jgi:hypothetical protein
MSRFSQYWRDFPGPFHEGLAPKGQPRELERAGREGCAAVVHADDTDVRSDRGTTVIGLI